MELDKLILILKWKSNWSEMVKYKMKRIDTAAALPIVRQQDAGRRLDKRAKRI